MIYVQEVLLNFRGVLTTQKLTRLLGQTVENIHSKAVFVLCNKID